MSESKISTTEDGKLIPNSTLTHFLREDEFDTTPVNSWEPINAAIYSLRDGPNYAKTNQKKPSEPHMYEVFSADLVHSEAKISDVIDRIQIPDDVLNFDEKKYGLPGMIMMNWMLPAYDPTMFGEEQTDGESYSIIMCAKISQESIKLLDEALAAGTSLKDLAEAQGIPPLEDDEDSGIGGLISSFMSWGGGDDKKKQAEERRKNRDMGALDPKRNPTNLPPAYPLLYKFITSSVDDPIKNRLKAITRICNLDDCVFNSVIRPLAKQYNGVPFIIKECADFRKIKNVYCVSIDVHLFSNISKQGLAGCRDNLATMSYDVCMVIQGEKDDELPERMVLGCRFNMMDLKFAAEFKL